MGAMETAKWPSSKTIMDSAPIALMALFVIAFSIQEHYSRAQDIEDVVTYRMAPESSGYRFALVGAISMTFPLAFNLMLDAYHALSGPDKAQQLQNDLQSISLSSQFTILLSTLIPCSILLATESTSVFWLIAHIQSHSLLQGGFNFVNAVCNRNEYSWDAVLYPFVLFLVEALHFEAAFFSELSYSIISGISGALTLVLLFLLVRQGMALREFFAVRAKEQTHVLPEEELSFIYLVIMAVWIAVVLFLHIALQQQDQDIDYCMVHTIMVGALAFLLGICNGVRAKQAAALAESALETKRVFVRHVSHEIRTPLNTTILGMKLVEAELQKPAEVRDESFLADLIADVNSSSMIAVDILNDLLLYEKIEGGLVSLEVSEVEAWEMVKEVLKVFRIQAKSSQIKLEYPDTCAQGYFVNVDKYKLSQVLRNLVSNALKFTSANGTVTVQAEVHKSAHHENGSRRTRTSMRAMKFVESVFPSKEFIRISVKDSGVGISKEDQRRLFREIVQFDAAKLQKGQGSGLGLWISSRIIRLHGGKIGVLSDGDGTGSVFYVDLPISRFHVDHPMDEMISSTLQSTYADLFQGHSMTSIQASFAKTSTKSTCSSIRSSASGPPPRRSLLLEAQPEVVYEARDEADSSSPARSPPRTRVYSNDSVNSFLLGREQASGSPLVGRKARAACIGSILPEGDASPIGSDTAAAAVAEPGAEGHDDSLEMHAQESTASPPPPMAFPALSLPAPASPGTLRTSHASLLAPSGDRGGYSSASTDAGYRMFFERRILIVDDAPSNRKVVNRLLRDKIAHRDEAKNGLEACDLVQASLAADRPYDCVLLDYFMPELDGPGAASRMREMGYAGVIVGVTGNNDVADITHFQRAGANHVVVKPLDADAFWNILTEQLSASVDNQV